MQVQDRKAVAEKAVKVQQQNSRWLDMLVASAPSLLACLTIVFLIWCAIANRRAGWVRKRTNTSLFAMSIVDAEDIQNYNPKHEDQMLQCCLLCNTIGASYSSSHNYNRLARTSSLLF